MNLLTNMKRIFILLCLLALSGCAVLDLKPITAEDVIYGFIIKEATGKTSSYGRQATCDEYKRIGGDSYREWEKDGKIACAYGQ
jgi:hypothetical protein|tara:strand:+ start:58 stop:309 length:252 start_codon:yes stop_codon:yes gene_type:complete